MADQQNSGAGAGAGTVRAGQSAGRGAADQGEQAGTAREGAEPGTSHDGAGAALRRLRQQQEPAKLKAVTSGGGSDDERGSMLTALLSELRRRDNAADGKNALDDEISLLGAFPRAMLAASDFQNFQVLLRETARGNAWDMDSMFGGC